MIKGIIVTDLSVTNRLMQLVLDVEFPFKNSFFPRLNAKIPAVPILSSNFETATEMRHKKFRLSNKIEVAGLNGAFNSVLIVMTVFPLL